MRLTVKALSKFGGLLSEENPDLWYTSDKKTPVSFAGLNKGDVIEVEANAKWIKSLTKLSSSSNSASPSNGTQSATTNTSKPNGTSRTDPQTRLEIARGTAIKAVMESPLVATTLKDADFSEAVSLAKNLIQSLTSYVLTGDFDVLNSEKTTEVK